MTLREKQAHFTINIAYLIIWSYNQGYELTVGDCYRDIRCEYGHPKSLHRQRLAIDLNLFKDGAYLTNTEDYKPLGDYWKSLHALNRWGGDFKNNPDGNHFSVEHEGMR